MCLVGISQVGGGAEVHKSFRELVDQSCLGDCKPADLLGPRGWLEIGDVCGDEELLLIARIFGTPVLLPSGDFVSRLKPIDKSTVRTRSFSFSHGLCAFPFHTDTSFWLQPARFIVLRAVAGSQAPTLLLSAVSVGVILSDPLAVQAIFCIRNCLGSFYGRIFFGDRRDFVRYDPCYMRAINAAAENLTELIKKVGKEQSKEIIWTGRNAIVVDNWRCLHGRGAVQENDSSRELSRIYVKE